MAQLPRYTTGITKVASPKDVSPTSMIAEAKGAASLSSRLASFSDKMFGAASSMAKTEAANKAINDFSNMREQSQKIRMDDTLNDDQKTEKIKELQSKSFVSSFGAYSSAYNSQMKAAYNNQIITDAQVAADLAIVESNGDPDTFMSMYRGFSQQTVKSAPDASTATVAQQAFMKTGTSAYRSLMMAKSRASTKQQKDTMKNAMDALGKQYSDAYYKDDAVSAANIKAHMTANVDSAVNSGLMTPEEGEVMLMSYDNMAIMDSAERRFNVALNSNRGQESYLEFIMDEKKGLYETVEPEDVAKLKSSMMSRIKEHNDNMLEESRFETESYEAMWEETYRDGVKMAAEGTLNESTILEWERTGQISKRYADDLRERKSYTGSVKFSDQKTMSRYAESDVLVDTEPYMILNDETISEKDKTALINRREQLLEGRYNWTKTNDGREAIRRIKSKFNIMEGTLLAKIDITNQNMQDFDSMYKDFYAKVTSSPNPDIDALNIADTLIKDYDAKKMEEELAASQERARQERAAADALAKEHNESWTVPWLFSPKTAQDFMMEK